MKIFYSDIGWGHTKEKQKFLKEWCYKDVLSKVFYNREKYQFIACSLFSKKCAAQNVHKLIKRSKIKSPALKIFFQNL